MRIKGLHETGYMVIICNPLKSDLVNYLCTFGGKVAPTFN